MNVELMVDNILDSLNRPTKSTIKKQVKVDQGGGRGKKKCPNCGKYVGVRTKKCVCGYEFVKGASVSITVSKNAEYEEKLSEEDMLYIRAVGKGKGGKVVYVGSGQCPSKLAGVDKDSVYDFCEDIVFSGMVKNKIYMLSAIKNWARHVLTLEDTIEKVFGFIDDWYNYKLGKGE